MVFENMILSVLGCLSNAGILRRVIGFIIGTMQKDDIYARFYEVIRDIPEGFVATYGQVASLAGYPGYARQVGYALHALPDNADVPWHRVINSKGMISLKTCGPFEHIQKQLLEMEGIQFDDVSRVSLKRYQWNP